MIHPLFISSFLCPLELFHSIRWANVNGDMDEEWQVGEKKKYKLKERVGERNFLSKREREKERESNAERELDYSLNPKIMIFGE